MNQSNEPVNHYVRLLQQVETRMKKATASHQYAIEAHILHQLAQVIELFMQQSDSAYQSGQEWLISILTHHPQLTPTIDRDLLWFFGGECLHFMTDEEISIFQKLDEMEAEHQQQGMSFDRESTKTLLKSQGDEFDA